MQSSSLYQLLADVVVIAHFAVALFVVSGLLFIVLGNKLAWSWVNGGWFRAAHLAAIAVIVAESWFGITCPLTALESWLRTMAGSPSYRESFIEHWSQRLLFYEAPTWVFGLAYTAFGLLVVATWLRFPPKFGRPRKAAPNKPLETNPDSAALLPSALGTSDEKDKISSR